MAWIFNHIYILIARVNFDAPSLENVIILHLVPFHGYDPKFRVSNT